MNRFRDLKNTYQNISRMWKVQGDENRLQFALSGLLAIGSLTALLCWVAFRFVPPQWSVIALAAGAIFGTVDAIAIKNDYQGVIGKGIATAVLAVVDTLTIPARLIAKAIPEKSEVKTEEKELELSDYDEPENVVLPEQPQKSKSAAKTEEDKDEEGCIR